MLVDFNTDGMIPLHTLRAIKQDLIGGDKQAYYKRGLVEHLVKLVSPVCDSESLYEMLVILNSFLIDYPTANIDFVEQIGLQ